jgi:hypothetical protein
MSNTSAHQMQSLIFHYQPNSTKTLLKTGKKQLPTGRVGQDKYPPRRIYVNTDEPVTAEVQAQNRPKHHGSETRQTDMVAGRVPFHIKLAVVQLAKKKGWTESYTVKKLLEQALAESIGEQLGLSLKADVKDGVKEEMQAFRTLFQWLLVRVAFDGSHTRSIVTNMLARWPGISKETKDAILQQTANVAKTNIFGKSKQLTELIQQFNLLMTEETSKKAGKGQNAV